jgi:site-specific recombinase XerD
MLTPTHAVDAFLDDLAAKSKSRKGRTETSYRRVLDKFTDTLGPRIDVTEITSDHVRGFFAAQRWATNTYATNYAILNSFFRWLSRGNRIRRNPMEDIPRPSRVDPMDLDVVTVDRNDVPRLLEAAESWTEILALHLALYVGARRSALASLRLRDYSKAHGRLKFYEKGGKAISKPVPHELRKVLDAAVDMGVYTSPEDYLIPSEGKTHLAERDDRIIWRVTKRVAKRAGVPAHVHALRAAFATFYLETHPGDLEGLRELLGHSSLEVTKVYLRKLDRQQAMERVRDLSWGSVAATGYATVSDFPQVAEKRLASSLGVGAGGFEPPYPPNPHQQTLDTQPAAGEA